MKEYIEKQIREINRFRDIAFLKSPTKALRVLCEIYRAFHEENSREAILEWAAKTKAIDDRKACYNARVSINDAIVQLARIFSSGMKEDIECALDCLENESVRLEEEILIVENSEEVKRNTMANEKLISEDDEIENMENKKKHANKSVSWKLEQTGEEKSEKRRSLKAK